MGTTSIFIIALAVLGLAFLILKFAAPKTKAEWDDELLDIVEGACKELGIDPEELAKKSIGKLKKKIKKVNK